MLKARTEGYLKVLLFRKHCLIFLSHASFFYYFIFENKNEYLYLVRLETTNNIV